MNLTCVSIRAALVSIKDLIFRLVALNVEECFLLVIKVSLTNRSHDNKSSGKPL